MDFKEISTKLDQIADRLNVVPSAIKKEYISEVLRSTEKQTIDLSERDDYMTLTINNFATELTGNCGVIGSGSVTSDFSMVYESTTGILTCNPGRLYHNGGGYFIAIGAYYRVVLFT